MWDLDINIKKAENVYIGVMEQEENPDLDLTNVTIFLGLHVSFSHFRDSFRKALRTTP